MEAEAKNFFVFLGYRLQLNWRFYYVQLLMPLEPITQNKYTFTSPAKLLHDWNKKNKSTVQCRARIGHKYYFLLINHSANQSNLFSIWIQIVQYFTDKQQLYSLYLQTTAQLSCCDALDFRFGVNAVGIFILFFLFFLDTWEIEETEKRTNKKEKHGVCRVPEAAAAHVTASGSDGHDERSEERRRSERLHS